jgi:hypothetical protein
MLDPVFGLCYQKMTVNRYRDTCFLLSEPLPSILTAAQKERDHETTVRTVPVIDL